MANQLLLPPQKFSYKEIADQFPHDSRIKKKVFFQAELRSLEKGDARFGIIAYVSWKEKGRWIVGKRVPGTDAGPAIPVAFTPPLAFANNEIVLAYRIGGKGREVKKVKEYEPKRARWNDFMKLIRKLWKDKELLERSFLLFETRISDNPHLEYRVTMNADGTSLDMDTKPSPPAPPEEG